MPGKVLSQGRIRPALGLDPWPDADELFWRLFWGQGYVRAPGFHTLLIFGHLAVVVWVWVLTGSKWTAPSTFTRQILGHPCFPEPMAELRLQT